MNRGDLVTIALPGDLDKPRPAFIIQSDQFDQTGTVTVLLVSGTLVDAPLIRTTIDPTPTNGLRKRSQIMVDKAMSVKRDKIGATIGRLDAEVMLAVTRTLGRLVRHRLIQRRRSTAMIGGRTDLRPGEIEGAIHAGTFRRGGNPQLDATRLDNELVVDTHKRQVGAA